MRLNRGTLVLGLVSIIVIVAVVVLSNQPGGLTVAGTPTATAQTAGPLFPEISATDKQSNTTPTRKFGQHLLFLLLICLNGQVI